VRKDKAGQSFPDHGMIVGDKDSGGVCSFWHQSQAKPKQERWRRRAVRRQPKDENFL
jgi:hypothetical protein